MLRTKRDHEQGHGERHAERAEVPRRMGGHPAIVSIHERGHDEDRLGDGHHREYGSHRQPRRRTINRSDRGEDLAGAVANFGRGAHAHGSVEGGGSRLEGPARRATREVLAEKVVVEHRVLAVEARRYGFFDAFTRWQIPAHTLPVVRLGAMVPSRPKRARAKPLAAPGEPGTIGMQECSAMDEMSRLALAGGAGDHVALRRLVSATQPQVWQLCTYLGSGDDVDDLVQETYLRALRSLASYRGDAPFIHWLLRIARRVCADDIRRRTRTRRALGSFAVLARTATEVPDRSGDVDLDLLVRRLDPERRDAFVLTQVLGLRYDEAAEVCDCAIGTIRSRVARARAELVRLARDADAV